MVATRVADAFESMKHASQDPEVAASSEAMIKETIDQYEVSVQPYHLDLMRLWALGRKNWLFVGSELAGQRAAVVMSLVQSAKLNGHEPWAYLKNVLARLPMHLNSRIDELLPHRWQARGRGLANRRQTLAATKSMWCG